MATSPEPRPPAPPPAAPRRPLRPLVALGVAVALAVGGAAAGLGWALRSAPGSAWLLAHVPGLKVSAPKGALLGGDFEAGRVDLLAAGTAVSVQGLAWRGLGLELQARSPWLRVTLAELRAARVDVQLPPSSGEPAAAPSSLRLPVELDIAALRVQTLFVNALGADPVRELAAAVHLSADAGTVHRLEGLELRHGTLQASGSARVRSDAPFDLRVSLALAQNPRAPELDWRATAVLDGPLAAPRLQATVRAEPATPGAAAQSLDLRTVLRPFERWPLGDLDATARAFDLSALNAAWPRTALDGEARAATTAIDRPAEVTVVLRNREPGLWNAARLPLRQLELTLRTRPDAPATIELPRVEAELGTEASPAGHLSASGRWTRARWTVVATLADVTPALLDARAPAMRLGGPVTLEGRGQGADAAIDLRATLAGALAARGPARAVQLEADATLAGARIELRKLLARAGGASATLTGEAQRRDADRAWQLAGLATLVDFDPLPWWPGRQDSPWRRGPHRLNAKAAFDLAVPDGTDLRTLAAVRGQARLDLARSQLAGVALAGQATLRNPGGGAAQAEASFQLDGNTLGASGQLDAVGTGRSDRWTLKLDAPALARLTPLWRLLRPADPAAALAGAATAKLQLAGRWPELTSEGEVDATGLRVDSARAERLQARWRLGTQADAPVDLRATLTQAALGQATFDTAELELQGRARDHRLTLNARSRSRPPAWVDTVQPPAGAAATETVAVFAAQGGLVDAPPQTAAGWRGRVQTLSVGPGSGGPPWLRAADVDLDAQWGGAPRATLQPGRAELLGAALRWSRIEWQAADGANPQRLEAQAEIEPFTVAPLLRRLQPDFGWGGDLAVVARLDVRSAPSVRADIVVERARGDLSVTDETGTQALGLSDLRLGLNAVDGVWSFTQGLAGSTLGVAAGAVVARTDPQSLWPAADTPIQGVLELRVAKLSTWGPWVPPGWRLGGALHIGAVIGGRFGAPEYTGRLDGDQLSVRNVLQGVNVTDGDLELVLQGATARIERFEARAGGGKVTIEGGATFGDTPRLDLRVVAERFQVLGRVDRRIVASGQGRLQAERERITVEGRFGLDEGLVDFSRSDAPSLSGDVEVVNRPNAKQSAAPAAPAKRASATPVALDLRVDLGERLRVRGRGLDTGLRGELRVTAPNGILAVNGQVRAVEGTYAAYGQKLSIDRGELDFNGPAENPRLDIEATRPNLDLRVGVLVTGSAQNPRIRLFSEPEMSEVDKLSYLVLGRASEGLGRTDTALLQRAAMALLAGEGESVTGQLTQAVGLDELSVRQTEGDVRETVVSLGKQLSRRWYVGYERGLNATTGTWQLVYRIAQRFTLRAQSGLDNSLDLIWTWRWD